MFPWLAHGKRKGDDEEELLSYIPLENIENTRGAASEDSSLRDAITEAEKPLPRHPSRVIRAAKQALGHLQFLVPSFLQRSSRVPRNQHQKAWLDGLRGLAALLVVFHHSSLVWFSWDLHFAWIPGQPLLLIKLPIIRLFVSGPPQVAVFFVVSGYAISYKPLRLARQGRFDEVGSTLSSSFFRRHPRLFMPAAVVTFFTALITQLDWFAREGLPGVAEPVREPPHANNLRDQLLHYAWTQVAVTDPIGQEHVSSGTGRRVNNPYDPNLWTLPIEFNSSMVVFMFLAAFTRVHNWVRMLFALALICYFHGVFRYWGLFLFLGGMFICDLHFELDRWTSRPAENPLPDEITFQPLWVTARQGGFVSRIARRITSSRVAGRVLGLGFFVLALWLLSMPSTQRGGREAAGYATIASWIPDRFGDDLVVPLGAVLLLLIVDRATFLQVLFTNSFSQYMGKISYSLYMVHGPLLWTLGSALGQKFVALTGGETNETYTLGIALAACVWWPVAIYVADLTYRCVDSKCVQLSRWVYEKLFKKNDV